MRNQRKKPNGTEYVARKLPGGEQLISFPREAEYDYYKRYMDADGTVRYVPVKEG